METASLQRWSGPGLGSAYSRDHQLDTLSQMIGQRDAQQSFKNCLSLMQFCLLPCWSLFLSESYFLRSNTFFMKPGSTGVLKDFFFFNERKKQHELHFQQFGARVYFLVFTFPEEHSLSLIVQLPDKQHKKHLDLRFVFSLSQLNDSVFVISGVNLFAWHEENYKTLFSNEWHLITVVLVFIV